ncbi:hypothetical protein BVG19_g5530 [[Candida] boidinii]|nr:hypothetical protein BVG19_g5530 [[Candida] boidinii]OWB53965.1 hypothetical protein B5S27_g5583 [[Candida] boidinii]
MSLVSQQQLLQNQLQLKSLNAKQQQQQTKSFTSQLSQQQQNNIQNSINEDSIVADSSNMNNNSFSNNSRFNPKKLVKQKDPSDPLAIFMPANANPTDELAARFSSWRTIIRSLIVYLKEIVSVNEEVVRQHIRLHHAITFPFVAQGLDGELYQPVRVTGGNTNAANNSSLIHNPLQSITSSSNINNIGISSVSNTLDDINITSTNNKKIFANNNSAGGGAAGVNPGALNDDFSLAQKFFLPLGNGSIQDLPTILYQYHSNSALLASNTVKELNQQVIPRLEDLRRDLLVKIKEIKGLQSDFKTNVVKDLQQTKNELSIYINSIELAKSNPSDLNPKNDPYLLKLNLERSIRRQLTEENYLHEAFINLQSSGKELEKVVYVEIQTALTIYAKLIGQQAQNCFDGLISKLDNGLLTKDSEFEWSQFISKNSNFIDPNLPMRHSNDISYNYQLDPLSFELRSGYLERKSKFLKSYSRSWYVLTPTFFHEFKSSDRKKDPIPVMSLSLDDCEIAEHSKKDEFNPNSYHKFVLHAKQNGLLHKGHNWVFRAESYNAMMDWYNDLKKLTSLSTPTARSAIAAQRQSIRLKEKNLLKQKKIESLKLQQQELQLLQDQDQELQESLDNSNFNAGNAGNYNNPQFQNVNHQRISSVSTNSIGSSSLIKTHTRQSQQFTTTNNTTPLNNSKSQLKKLRNSVNNGGSNTITAGTNLNSIDIVLPSTNSINSRNSISADTILTVPSNANSNNNQQRQQQQQQQQQLSVPAFQQQGQNSSGELKLQPIPVTTGHHNNNVNPVSNPSNDLKRGFINGKIINDFDSNSNIEEIDIASSDAFSDKKVTQNL